MRKAHANRLLAFVLVALAGWALPLLKASADTQVIDFEGTSDLTPVNDCYANLGLHFQGATILTTGKSGGSLNPHFPPHSGTAVIYDDVATSHGVIQVDFDPTLTSEVHWVGGFVTGNREVTLEAYDAHGTLLGSATTGGANYLEAGTGIRPNRFLKVSSQTPITRLIFHDTGNTFTVDDLLFGNQVAPSQLIDGLLASVKSLPEDLGVRGALINELRSVLGPSDRGEVFLGGNNLNRARKAFDTGVRKLGAFQ